jgi:hypothetical protein
LQRTIDVFPAIIVAAPSGAVSNLEALSSDGAIPEGAKRLDRTRVVVINNVLMVAIDSPTGPKLIFREQLVNMIQDGLVTKVQTVSGKTLAFRKDSNCGCGSRLRSWSPHKGILMSEADPFQ